MKDKRDTKTLELGLAKTNAERQRDHRERIKRIPGTVRLNTYTSKKADDNLALFMEEYGLTKKEAITIILESLPEIQLTDALDATPLKNRTTFK